METLKLKKIYLFINIPLISIFFIMFFSSFFITASMGYGFNNVKKPM
jgi:hypothetical protein